MESHRLPIPPIRLPERDFSIRGDEFPGTQEEFEIRFFESVLEHDPDHEESLVYLGHCYTARGDVERGLEMDLRLQRLRPTDPVVHYNLGCSYALLGRNDEAIAALERAVELGYRDALHMAQDKDLENLHRDPRFMKLIRSLLTAQVV